MPCKIKYPHECSAFVAYVLSLSTSKNQKLTAPFCVAFPCPGTSYQQRGKARGLTKSSLSEFLREALCELYPYKYLVGGWTNQFEKYDVSSNWIIETQVSGSKFEQSLRNHHPVIQHVVILLNYSSNKIILPVPFYFSEKKWAVKSKQHFPRYN